MTAPTDRDLNGDVATNRSRLAQVRLGGLVAAPSLNQVVDPSGRLVSRPGQGGMVIGVGLGEQATSWESDHLEPGATLNHPDPAANRALQVLACVGNVATVRTGPAAGLRGAVYGKHGGVLVAFPDHTADIIAPGDHVTIDTIGVGLRINDEPEVYFHSCAPNILDRILRGRTSDGRLRVRVRTEMPREAAAAGIGMPSNAFNIDLDVRHLGDAAGRIAFGDVVLLRDHDHRFGRQHRLGWVAVGVVAHGRSVGGGHGVGMTTLLTAPVDRLEIELTDDASLAQPLTAATS